MVKNINESFDQDEFERLNSVKRAHGGSWSQVITEAFEALAEREGYEWPDLEREIEADG